MIDPFYETLPLWWYLPVTLDEVPTAPCNISVSKKNTF